MSLTYYKFLFFNTLKRKGVWITWLLYLLTVTAFIIILPVASTLSVYQLWSNTTVAICQAFVGLAVAIFTAVLSVNIFKDVNEDGTDLIIISKPISRFRIVASKFLIFFTLCIIVNLTAVAVTSLTFFIPNLEKKFYWGLVLSMFIGNLVTFGLYGSIAILLSTRFVKAGIIVCNVIVAIVLFVYQILCVFVFSNSILNLAQISDGAIAIQSFILPVRNEDGSYTEKNIANFVSTPNTNNEYDMKVVDWDGVKKYWDEKNANDHSYLIIGTDIGTQLSLTYSSVNVNGYSDRQAKRMYNFSRYYDYELTQPASPEFYENDSPLKIVYTDETPLEIEGVTFYIPAKFVMPGVKSTKSSYLKGTITDVIPIADIKGKETLAYYDVTFEKEDWNKYKDLFDIMYDNVFRYDVGNNKDYYSYTLKDRSNDLDLNQVWCWDNDNFGKYYKLVWACFTGHHGDDEYFGKNDPLNGKTKDDFGISSVFDLNCRFLQFKNYCFYKAQEEQSDLMINGDEDRSVIEKAIHAYAVNNLEDTLKQYGLTCSGTGIGDYGYILRAPKDGGSEMLQPGTQTINNSLLHLVAEATKVAYERLRYTPTSKEWIDLAVNGSYAKWLKTASIVTECANLDEDYLFDSLDTPERNDTYTSSQYTSTQTWIPYYINLAAKDAGIYYPFGQNLQFSFYEAKNRVQFWYFAAIWGGISLMAYAGAFIVYNRYDIK